jgi:hypothetical protein
MMREELDNNETARQTKRYLSEQKATASEHEAISDLLLPDTTCEEKIECYR